jgi:sec-independent protein translocase protein TatA
MGLGGLHLWQLIFLAFIVLVVFGTKKLKNVGEDLGGAINGFRKAMHEGKQEQGRLISSTDQQATASKAEQVSAKARSSDAD